MAVDGSALGCHLVDDLQFETDRARFLGREGTPADPAAMSSGVALSGTTGPVLDPIFSLRRRFRLGPGGSAVIGFTLALAESRDVALALADKYHEASAVARAFELAWAHSQVEHEHRNWSPEDAHLYQRLGSHLLFAGPALRATAAVIAANHLAQPALWRFGVSGDRPIILARIAEAAELSLVRQLLVAHTFLRLKGLEAELILLDEERAGDSEGVSEQLTQLVRETGGDDLANKPGGVFVLRRELLTEDEAILLEAAARVVLDGARGSLSTQLDRIEWVRSQPEPLAPTQPSGQWNDEPVCLPPGLQFDNGLGGFSADGHEYCVLIRASIPYSGLSAQNGQPGRSTNPKPILPPAPWINVVANPTVGFLISEGGAGYTWAGNSQTNRLTGWSNDPVIDPPSEVIYLRDEQTGEIWCPTPLPIPAEAPVLVRHGQGYTIFASNAHGLEHELTLSVPAEDPVKLVLLRIRNATTHPRRLSATFYVEWVLGMSRDASAMHVVTELDPDTGALLARNAFRTDFGGRMAFIDVNRRPRTITADRNEFLGRHGSLAAPAALGRTELSGRVGAGIDPCAAVQAKFELAPGETTEIVFQIGEAESVDAVRALVRRYWDAGSTAKAVQESKSGWDDVLGAVEVSTPDPALDLLLNRWLLYQVRSCRLWARSAFYQSGGAYGFRDQLQDVMALLHAAPAEARARFCARPHANSWKETFSTGGTRLSDVGFAPASRTIFSGFPMLRACTWRQPEIHQSLRSRYLT